MANTRNSKKNVKRNNTTRKRHAKSHEKITDAKNKMRGESQQATLINLLRRPEGTTIDEMTEVTGWQRHCIRGVMSGILKKQLGLFIAAEKEERWRIYCLAAICSIVYPSMREG